jgi:hypothetical protein
MSLIMSIKLEAIIMKQEAVMNKYLDQDFYNERNIERSSRRSIAHNCSICGYFNQSSGSKSACKVCHLDFLKTK